MVAQAAGVGMGAGRFSNLWRGLGLQAMPDVRLHTTQLIESVCEVPLGAGVLQMSIPRRVVGVVMHSNWVADGVIVKR
jgi:hypothetical protein